MGRLASWKVSDEFWERVAPLIPKRQRDPQKQYKNEPGSGRKPLPARQVFEAILYVLRTGIQWKALPKEQFGSASSVHQYFQEWEKAGVFEALWQKGLSEYDEFEGIGWEWQSIDGSMVKAPLARESVGKNPTDRGKNGDQAQRVDRCAWDSTLHCIKRRQHPRRQVAGTDARCSGG
jgi:putative transposase